ncbi:hypothetical protein EV356DRAFT_143449 [Viridothelium virens]|uniref:BTB domain-containing protein n=1 Tax=Viridothelium virens TaxID=1048519 RepID=A0A6A6HAA9_VIRVR|nr:hypothetical protein EV356DRAFT_143449 [Viridothelium virens]
MALGYIGLIIQRVLGNIVKVVVGPAAKEVHVHEELLASSCPFFQTALKEKQKRGQTRVIEMPGDDYDALELYVLWLYSDKKKIWSISSDNDASREYLKSQGETLLLARAIILAEKLQDVHFLNTVVNAIMERTKVFDEDGNRWFPGPPAVNTIWENTRQGSPVRRLLLDQYVWHGEKSWMKPTNEIEAFNADFLRALVMSMFGRPHEVPKILPCDVENNHLYHKKESRRRGEKRKGEEPESATTLENGVKKRRNESNFPGPSSPSKRELQLGTFSTKNLSRHLGATGGSSSGAAPDGQKEDYADKGLDSVENKFGVDSAKYRSTNEKITDAARGQFEKSTGKDVPDKFSN